MFHAIGSSPEQPIIEPRTEKADFCLEIDYAKNSPNPSRVFRAMSDLIEALQSVDHTLLEPLETTLQPIFLLEILSPAR